MSDVIAVVDYGMGNLHSAAKALEKVSDDQKVLVTSDPEQIVQADRVVFPGVGAIRDCIGVLAETGLDQAVMQVARSGKPLLGICVGMQALMEHSQENNGVDCLGLFKGQVNYFGDHLQDDFGHRLKVPHMGWNQVRQNLDHPMWQDIPDNSRFYFVHSYCVQETEDDIVAGACEYGVTFAAAVARDNVFAVQFHPEKSAACGLSLLYNFLNWSV